MAAIECDMMAVGGITSGPLNVGKPVAARDSKEVGEWLLKRCHKGELSNIRY